MKGTGDKLIACNLREIVPPPNLSLFPVISQLKASCVSEWNLVS